MSTAPSNFETIDARLEPALCQARELNRASFGRFCAELERLRCLTLTQMLVAKVLANVTLKDGFNSLPFRSLEELTALGTGAFGGFAKNDLSLAINGGTRTVNGAAKRVAGLTEYGIFRLDVRREIEQAMPVSILLVIADSRQWSVPGDAWRWTDGELRELVMHARSLRRRHTPALQGLAAEADLHDARAMHVNADPAGGIGGASGGRGVFLDHACDARDGRKIRATTDVVPTCGTVRSDMQNEKRPANAAVVPTCGTLRARASVNREQEQITVQLLNSSSSNRRVNELLAELEMQFARAHGADYARKEMVNSGGCWRNVAARWPVEFEYQVAELKRFITDGGKFTANAHSWLQYYFTRYLRLANWQSVCQKSKESLSTH